jgi:hypothetical protein
LTLIKLEVTLIVAQILLNSLTVRIHSKIARHPCARLWYLLKAFNIDGSGHNRLPVVLILNLLRINQSTLYRYMKIGIEKGFFRRIQITEGNIDAWLGSINVVSQKLELSDWGTVGDVPLVKVLAEIRKTATGITTQSLQGQSHYAAKIKLKNNERAIYAPPSAEEIFALIDGASHKPAGGTFPFILHIGPKRIFASKSFVPFGASQRAIADSLGISDRTVRRHLASMGVNSRQIVQSKAVYRQVVEAMRCEADYFRPNDDLILTSSGNEYCLGEKGHRTLLTSERFFKHYGQTWIYRCSLYDLDFDLKSMAMARHEFKLGLKRAAAQDTQPETPKARIIETQEGDFYSPQTRRFYASEEEFKTSQILARPPEGGDVKKELGALPG